MSLRMLAASVALMLCVATNASAQQGQGNPIVEQIKGFVAAYNAKDAGAVSRFYLQQGALLPPRSPRLVGRDAIAKHYANAFQRGASTLGYKIIEIKQVGPGAAIEVAITSVKVGQKVIQGRSLHVWNKSGDKWLLARDIYHVLSVN